MNRKLTSFIPKLRELTATGFANSSPSCPDIQISIVSDNSKQSDRINTTRSGEHYLARREGDTAVYELSASSMNDILQMAEGIKPASGFTK